MLTSEPSSPIGNVSPERLAHWRVRQSTIIALRAKGSLSDHQFRATLEEQGFKSDALRVEMNVIDDMIAKMKGDANAPAQ